MGQSTEGNLGQRRFLDCDPLFSLWFQEGHGMTNGIPTDIDTFASIEESTISGGTISGCHSLMADDQPSSVRLSLTRDGETNQVVPPVKTALPASNDCTKEKDMRAYFLGQKTDDESLDNERIKETFRRRKKKLHGGFDRPRKSKHPTAPSPKQIPKNTLKAKFFEKDEINFSEMNGRVDQLIREIMVEGVVSGDESDLTFPSTLPRSGNRVFNESQVAASKQRAKSLENNRCVHSYLLERNHCSDAALPRFVWEKNQADFPRINKRKPFSGYDGIYQNEVPETRQHNFLQEFDLSCYEGHKDLNISEPSKRSHEYGPCQSRNRFISRSVLDLPGFRNSERYPYETPCDERSTGLPHHLLQAARERRSNQEDFSRALKAVAQLVTQREQELQFIRATASIEKRWPSAPRARTFNREELPKSAMKSPPALRIHRLAYDSKEKRQEDSTSLPLHLAQLAGRSINYDGVREPSCDSFTEDKHQFRKRDSRIPNNVEHHKSIDLNSFNNADHHVYKYQVPPSEQLALGARVARQESDKLARALHDLASSKARLRSRSAPRARTFLQR